MNEFETFEISKKRTLVAMQEWLRTWQSPSLGPLYCPYCKAQKVRKRLQSKQGKTHQCSACRQNFSLEDLPECRCFYPGRFPKCTDCPHYQRMMAYVSRRKPQLEPCTEGQLDEMLSSPQLYTRSAVRPLSKTESFQAQSHYSSQLSDTNQTGLPLQLTLFLETIDEDAETAADETQNESD